MTVAYLEHPLGDEDGDGDPFGNNSRSSNLANALEWFRFLRATTRWAICYPALAYVAADRMLQRPSQITGMVEILACCHVVVLTGWMSPHMLVGLRRVESLRRPAVIDLLDLGRCPPWDHRDQVAHRLARVAVELGL